MDSVIGLFDDLSFIVDNWEIIRAVFVGFVAWLLFTLYALHSQVWNLKREVKALREALNVEGVNENGECGK